MILFPVYAVFIWYLCFRWRRRWVGLAMPVLGVIGVAALEWVYAMVAQVIAAIDTPLFPMMLLGEAGLVLVVGVFIAGLPRDVAEMPCRRCGYDLAGLESVNPRCPECGLSHAARKVKRRCCRACSSAVFVLPHENPACPACGIDHAVKDVRPACPLSQRRWAAPMVAAWRRAVGPLVKRRTKPTAALPTVVVVRGTVTR